MADAHTPDWHDIGAAVELAGQPLQEVRVGRTRVALSHIDGVFSAIHGLCNHVGGPLGQGTMEDGYVVCPWHGWKFDARDGKGEPGFEEDRVPSFPVKVEGGRVLIDMAGATPRMRKPHPPHPLTQVLVRGEPGGPSAGDPLRVVGISTTNMDMARPRYSTSDDLLNTALAQARERGADTRLIRLAELSFRHCEGYYSKSAHACTWPCSITQMDPGDQMDRVYEAFTQWGDVFIVATPIRWGQPSSLYTKMVERMNCIQNQETLSNKVLLKRKVVGFIITGGQDNIQAVAGQMLTFFAELGCQFPTHPFIAHSRGWSAEDMENNMSVVRKSKSLHEGAAGLADRCLDTSAALVGLTARVVRGGRKAHAE